MSTPLDPGPARFWAKLGKDSDSYHPLVGHSADVAAVFEAVSAPGTALHDRLSRAAGPDADLERIRQLLVYLAALHDLGKANHGFQEKAGPWERNDRSWPARGHVIPVIASSRGRGAFSDALRPLIERMPLERQAAHDAFVTTIAHHGRPWVSDPRSRPVSNWSRLWMADEDSGRDPLAEIQRLGAFALGCSGLDTAAGRLDWSPALSNLFAGLLTLSDWIGSTQRIFPPSPEADDHPEGYWREARRKAEEAVRQIGVRPSRVSPPTADIYRRLFPSIFQHSDPTPLQSLVCDLALPNPGARVVIESETGSGKTEAVLALYARLRAAGQVDGLVFALPTRATATAMYNRVRACASRLHPEGALPTISLAMGGSVGRPRSVEPPTLDPTLYPDDEDRATHSWASENHKRYFAAEIVVGTVDQVLLAGLPVKHAHMRLALLTRHLVVVDEVHSYDRYMNAVLNRVLAFHASLGGVSAFLSATLSCEARNGLAGTEREESQPQAVWAPYPAVSIHDPTTATWSQHAAGAAGREKEVSWTIASQNGRTPDIFDEAMRVAQAGGRACVLRNTVREARATVETLTEIAPEFLWRPFGSRWTPAYHSRYIPGDRERIDEAVREDFGKNSTRRGVILVATQVIEQSLDVDFDWMMTDLAPVDVLLQRIGRLHRHERPQRPTTARTARLLVQAPEDAFPPRVKAYGEYGWGTVYEDWGDLELTRRLIVDRSTIVIPRDNRMLVEGVYHPEARQAFVDQHPEWSNAMDAAEGRRLGLDTAGQMGALALERGYSQQVPQFDAATADRIRTRIGDDRISVALDRPVRGCYAVEATANEVSLRLEQLVRGGLEDFEEPRASFQGDTERGPVYRVGPNLRLRYGPEGWVEMRL